MSRRIGSPYSSTTPKLPENQATTAIDPPSELSFRKAIYPTRLIYGLTLTTPEEAKSFDTIAYDPLNPKYAYIYKQAFHYLNTPTKTGQVPPGQ